MCIYILTHTRTHAQMMESYSLRYQSPCQSHNKCVCVCVCVYTHIHTYTYAYIQDSFSSGSYSRYQSPCQSHNKCVCVYIYIYTHIYIYIPSYILTHTYRIPIPQGAIRDIKAPASSTTNVIFSVCLRSRALQHLQRRDYIKRSGCAQCVYRYTSEHAFA